MTGWGRQVRWEGVRRILLVLTAVAGLLVAFRHPGFQNDFVFDWLVAKAFVSGLDPYMPMSVLADHFGIAHSLFS